MQRLERLQREVENILAAGRQAQPELERLAALERPSAEERRTRARLRLEIEGHRLRLQELWDEFEWLRSQRS